ncbi:MAG: DUF2207 domain-containing protein [Candidatus Kerfeldbacteria bacterium]|nr:DUF2207 domain-containing protein [Candidatus Kerfeldbacteria bacterium]
MYRRTIVVSLAILLTLFVVTHSVQAEQISSFEVNISIEPSSVMMVTEKITYDFGDGQRHGIFRDIPYAYSRSGNAYKLRLAIVSVTDELGQSEPYALSRSGGMLHIKIGDPETLVSGEQTYQISYTVERAINYFGDHDELYWNVTGNDWPVGIEAAVARITLSRGLTDDQRLTQCFTGPINSTESNCHSIFFDEYTAVYTSDTLLSPYEGLTIVLGWPGGITTPPTTAQRLIWFVQDNWAVAIPIIVLIGMYTVWYRRGRDPLGQKTIIPQYEAPDRLSAGLVGTIVDEKAQLRDISAALIQLAVKGYLKIIRHEDKKFIGTNVDYEFVRLRIPDSTLGQYEQDILNALFAEGTQRRLKDLKNKFYRDLPKIKKSMYAQLTTEGYFPASPDNVRNVYSGIAGLIVVIGFSIIFFNSAVAGIMTAISGVIALFVAQHMPRKTKKGVQAFEHIQGLTWFLKVTEKERLKFHNAPERSPKQFESLLPYAMALGVETQWANQFADLYVTPPEWYSGGPTNHFSALFLIGSLQSMSSDFRSVAVSRPSSAGSGGSGFGGGFSGGGFGGGGGGSW